MRDDGAYFDKETGMVYNWHRYRDLGIGRFIQADWLGLNGGDLSLYVLRKNNPLSFIDPKGLQIAPPGGGTAGGAAGGFGGLGGFGGRGGMGGRGSSPTGNAELDRALNGGSATRFDDSGSTVGDGDEWRASYLWCKFKCDAARHVNNFNCRMHFILLSNDPDAYFLCMRRSMWIWQECVEDCKSACTPP